jgi:hypothetical protein
MGRKGGACIKGKNEGVCINSGADSCPGSITGR